MADLASDATDQPSLAQLRREIRALRAAVRFLRSSRDLVGRATVDAGKELLIKGMLKVDGTLALVGDMDMRSSAGDLLVRLGDMVLGDRGLEFYRETGSKAFELRKRYVPTNPQSWSWYDDAGHLLVGEAELLGGLDRPMLEHPFQPVAAASGTAVTCGPYGFERTATSGSWTTLFAHDGKRQNPLLDLKIAAVCSDGSTAAEVRVVDEDTGVQLPGWLAAPWIGVIPVGTTTLTVIDAPPNEVLTAVFDTHAPMRLGLQCRRTAGAGTITIAIAQSIGG